ncbi:MAG TPA: aldehyde dehydrogenase family protein, partial [Candidatus Dojkabacteria bacterium]
MPIVSMNPYTGETIKEFEALSDSEIKSKLDKAQAVFEEWKTKSYEDRADLFMKFAEVLEENKQEYAEIIAQEMGKPIKVGIGEIEKCAWNARFYAENTSKFLEIEPIETDAGEKSLVRFDPMGIIVFVMPWNFPFWQVIRQAVPTIMAGNTVVLKHSSNVPQSALKIQEAFEKTGFPEGTFQTLLIGSDQVEQVISDFRVKAISLTGSEGAGSAVASLGGKYLKKSVMELGGNDPFLVFEDADIASAVKNCASARMKNSGQVCNSPKRVVVLEEVAEEFIKGLKESYEALKLGDPMSEETDLGPLSMESILNDVSAQVEKSVKAGAEIITGGKKP